MLKCKGCGADIPFVPESQSYICPYCDTVHTQEELTEQEKAGEIRAQEHVFKAQAAYNEGQASGQTAQAADNLMDVYIYTCPQCGGELITTEETYATFCSYCGSSVLLNKREGKEEKPRYIIPFKISREQAAQIYKDTMNKAFFAPKYIREMDIEKVRGIYMPYWTYTTNIKGTAGGMREDHIRQHKGTLVNTYEVKADVDISGNGIEYDAASSFPDDLSQSAGPFHFNNAQDFAASYMSGFYADRGNMPKESYAQDALNDMMEIAKPQVASRTRVAQSKLHFDVENQVDAEKAMYPFWFISARNHKENRVSYAVINGETGKIAADIPADPKKLFIGTMAIGVPLFLLLYLLLVPTPRITAIVTMIMSLIGLVIGGIVIGKKELRSGKAILMNALAGIISLVLFIWNPFRDEIFYIGLVTANLLCVLSYLSVFAKNNKLMLRKLPQLGARGGDENA